MAVFVMLTAPLAEAAASAGKVLFAKGAVTARSGEAPPRLVARDAKLLVGDTISTTATSFALIEFNDGTRLTLRPGTVFKIDDYRYSDKEESAVFSLLKGGLRAITGLIGKRNPDAYKIKTPVATLGIRGTEFDARLCEADCARENQKLKGKKSTRKSAVVGRVVFKKGKLHATDITGKSRQLGAGGPLYKGDKLTTPKNGHAVLAFRDDSRITLQPATEFVIQEYHYGGDAEAEKQEDSFLMNLVKGGLRAATGKIAKENPDKLKLRTPTSTIGVRGTGFDVYHKNPTWAHVWSGTISFELDSGTLLVEKGQTIFLPKAGGEPVYLPEIPVFFENLPGERPDQVDVDPELFSETEVDETTPGLYVSVVDGHVQASQDGEVVDLGRGEALQATGEGIIRLQITPRFMEFDIFPRPGEVDPKTLELMQLIKQDLSDKDNVECEVQ